MADQHGPYTNNIHIINQENLYDFIPYPIYFDYVTVIFLILLFTSVTTVCVEISHGKILAAGG